LALLWEPGAAADGRHELQALAEPFFREYLRPVLQWLDCKRKNQQAKAALELIFYYLGRKYILRSGIFKNIGCIVDK
jgi:hypothetical protein